MEDDCQNWCGNSGFPGNIDLMCDTDITSDGSAAILFPEDGDGCFDHFCSWQISAGIIFQFKHLRFGGTEISV